MKREIRLERILLLIVTRATTLASFLYASLGSSS